MTHEYADQATKTFKLAKPTIDVDGKVVRWEIEVEYSLDGYVSKLNREIDVAPMKPPSAYTKDELIAATNFDAIYDSQYQSVKMSAPAPERTVIDNFDLKTLG